MVSTSPQNLKHWIQQELELERELLQEPALGPEPEPKLGAPSLHPPWSIKTVHRLHRTWLPAKPESELPKR